MVKHFAPANVPDYSKLLTVPERIPELTVQIGEANMCAIIMAEIQKFCECFTVVRPMSADQIAFCALAIMQTAEEDRLSLNDLVVFFEGAKQSKYGRILDHIDQSVIFEHLEVYREYRHQWIMSKREEMHAQYKSMGFKDRSSDGTDQDITAHREAMKLDLKMNAGSPDKA